MKWWKNDAIIQRKIKNLCSYAFYYKVFKMIYKLENVSGFILIYHTAGTLLLDPFIACRTIKFGVADVKTVSSHTLYAWGTNIKTTTQPYHQSIHNRTIRFRKQNK